MNSHNVCMYMLYNVMYIMHMHTLHDINIRTVHVPLLSLSTNYFIILLCTTGSIYYNQKIHNLPLLDHYLDQNTTLSRHHVVSCL